MTNPLIAENKGPSGTAGAGLLDSGYSAWKDIGQDGKTDWVTLAVDGLSVGLDLLGMALNPLGEIVKAGVGWLMEHIAWIREPLEMLTGDPAAITAVSQTWGNIAKQMSTTAQNYETALGGISTWAGEAAEGYRSNARDYIAGLRAMASHSDDVGQGVAIAGMVVATERAIVFDMIASFVSRIITQAIVAAAAAGPTLGGSMAAFFTSLGVDLTITASNLTKRMAKLLTIIKRFVAKFEKLGETGKKVAKTLGDRSQAMHNWADRAVKTSPQRLKIKGIQDLVNSSSLKKFTEPIGDFNSKFGDAPGALNDSYAQKTGKESAKAYKEGEENINGGKDE
ncbi:hypothetical protein AB0I28_11715 [Phytomonospora sp. NPDC050363]|uniref:WXG100 family type VII secretion target n=1 Tax=Phytomonospora sp. NPDC050363 TaxID=3155642 RepID=UPI0033D0A292